MPHRNIDCDEHCPRAVGRPMLGIAVVLSLVMSACAAASDVRLATHERFIFDPTTAFFAGAYREIRDYYIDPVSLETLTLAGIARLEPADGSFAIEESGGSVVFRDHGTVFAELPVPEPTDAEGWAAVTSAAISAARAHTSEYRLAGDEQVYQRIFDGITPKLDRFTHYSGSEAARDQRASRDGFGGIGVTLDYTGTEPRVSSVLPQGPAEHAGIRVDDRLTAVDGIPIANLNQRQLIERLRGPIDTHVALTLERPQRTGPFVVQVVRALIVPPTVTAERDDGIAVFRVAVFNHNTAESLADQMSRLKVDGTGKGVRGVVLDLRDNPGGLLDQAVDVTSLFLDRGIIVSARGRHPTATQEFMATDHDVTHGLPLVVLVNGGSASASEIVAAALQDEGRAVVIGSSSYGKGTVQMVLTLENNGELTLTWARLFAPSGYLLHQHGVVPTFCTSGPAAPELSGEEAADRIQRILERGVHPEPGIETEPRASLSDAAWTELRASCPADPHDNALDLKLAKRLLKDPLLYAKALNLPGVTVAHAGRGIRSALQ